MGLQESPKEQKALPQIHEQGILPLMLPANPGLEQRISHFFSNSYQGSTVLFIGGEPGHGKSLLIADLLRKQECLSGGKELNVIKWDNIHAMYFERLSEITGMTLSLPEGETDVDIRQFLSQVLSDSLQFAIQTFPRSRTIVEAPFVGSRGENTIQAVSQLLPQENVQVLIMHSPEMWRQIVYEEKTRSSKTSGQIPAMMQIRMNRLEALHIASMDEAIQNELLLDDWQTFLKGKNGMVVTWNPNRDKTSFTLATEVLEKEQSKLDTCNPTVLAYVQSLIDGELQQH